MYRYAFGNYKTTFGCFKCRKAFKRRNLNDIVEGTSNEESKPAKCPQCGVLMAEFGRDYKVPKTTDVSSWSKTESYFKLGMIHHTCGCYGLGYLPNHEVGYREYLSDVLERYQNQYKRWSGCESSLKKKEALNSWASKIEQVELVLLSL